MTMEHWMLLAGATMGLVHLSACSFTFKAQTGMQYSISNRDEDIKPTGMAGRMLRAQRNFLETFPVFIAFIYLIDVTQTAGPLSYWGCILYLACRVIYLPLYAAGIPWLRTISWLFATTGLALIGIQIIW